MTNDDMLQELYSFLKNKVGNYDLVIGKERSGFRIFQLLVEKYFGSRVHLIPSKSVHLFDLRDVRVLLFDDVTTSGRTLSEMAEELRKRGANVETMTYIVLDTCQQKSRPTYHVKVVAFKEYYDFSHHISEFMEGLEPPLDTDHIRIEGTISPQNPSGEEIYNSLVPLGEVYEGKKLPNGWQFGLRAPNFCDIESLELPYMTKKPRTWKLRIRYTLDGRIRVIPLSFPILNEMKGTCSKDLPICFCEHYDKPFDKNDQSKMLLCCFCIIYNSSATLMINFFESWKKSLENRGFKLAITKVVYEDAEDIFKDKQLEERLLLSI